MATSSFQKQFIIKKKNVDNFVKEMSKKVAPKLDEDFETKFTSNKNIMEKITRILK